MATASFCRPWALAGASALLLAAGCVEPFSGSNLQIDFSASTQTMAETGAPDPLQPPLNTAFTLYAIQQVIGNDGVTVEQEFVFPIESFEIHPVIDLGSPCFIELGDTAEFPGLHSTQFAAKMRELTGIADGRNPPSGADPVAVQRVLTAEQRVANQVSFRVIKAVTSVRTAAYPTVSTGCVEDGVAAAGEIPAPSCLGDASAQRRLELCQAFWDANPSYYEGNDAILTAPLAGELFGMVQGNNPINQAPLGGTQFFVDEVLRDFDRYAVYWQYKDLDGDGDPDYPDAVPEAERTVLGEVYMRGVPSAPTRGVVRVDLSNPLNPAISARMAIVPSLADDDVNF